MSNNHVYKKVEIVGSSEKSIEGAIENALAESSKEHPQYGVVRSDGNPWAHC